MKQRRAVLALGISIVVLAALFAARYFAHRGTRTVAPQISASTSAARASASSVVPAVSGTKPPLAGSASASASSVRPPAPPYLDTTATTLAEQRSALFTNMQNQ